MRFKAMFEYDAICAYQTKFYSAGPFRQALVLALRADDRLNWTCPTYGRMTSQIPF